MRIVDDFLVDAQEALGDHEVVYLHDAEGSMVAALVSIPYLRKKESDPPEMPVHDHLEPGMEVNW